MKGDYSKFKYLTHIEAWKLYKEKYPDSKISYRKFRQVIKTLGEKVEEHVFTNPLGVDLPYCLGILQMVGFIPRAFYIFARKYQVRTDGFYYKMFLLRDAYAAKLPRYEMFNLKNGKHLQSRVSQRILKDEFFHWVKVLKRYKTVELVPAKKSDVV